MDAIHHAAYDGNLATLDQLLEEDGDRLEAQTGENAGYISIPWCRGKGMMMPLTGFTPLELASYKGHDPVVKRLIALGADTAYAARWACYGGRLSTMEVLLNAGSRVTPGALHWAMANDQDIAELILSRGSGAYQLDAQDWKGRTALHMAAKYTRNEMARLLLKDGADPSIRDKDGNTPLDVARRFSNLVCAAMLEAEEAKRQRALSLLKVRALVDAAHVLNKVRRENKDKGLSAKAQEWAEMDAVPVYLKGRVATERELPVVAMDGKGGDEVEEQLACLKYAMGLEGGGGYHEGDGPAPPGLPKEVFVELCEYIVPKWARPDM